MEKLKNPSIVAFYGICLEKRCIVMEYMPMGSLYDFLNKKSVEQFSWGNRYIIAKDIIEGLSYIHSKNILHRDIKSLNVLLTHDYKAKLTDFGLSYQKITTRSHNQTLELKEEDQGACGTLAWMAPELFSLNPTYSTASDIYGYGIILWEMATHKIPYKNSSSLLIRTAILKGMREYIPKYIPEKMYTNMIEQCWSHVAKERPTTDELKKTLEKIMSRKNKVEIENTKNWGALSDRQISKYAFCFFDNPTLKIASVASRNSYLIGNEINNERKESRNLSIPRK